MNVCGFRNPLFRIEQSRTGLYSRSTQAIYLVYLNVEIFIKQNYIK